VQIAIDFYSNKDYCCGEGAGEKKEIKLINFFVLISLNLLRLVQLCHQMLSAVVLSQFTPLA